MALSFMEVQAMVKKTHQTHFTVPALPWHDKEHAFGVATDTGNADSVQPTRPRRKDLFTPLELVETGRCHYCRQRPIYRFDGRTYCGTCWVALEIGEELYQ